MTTGRRRSWRASYLLFAGNVMIGLVYGDFVDFSRDDASDGRVITVRRFDPASPYQLTRLFRS